MSDCDAIDNFLLWELCKQQDIQRKIVEESPDGEKLKNEVVEKVRQNYHARNYDLSEKMELLRELDGNPEYRSKIFRNCSWRKETVKIEKLGTTVPRAGDLPPEVITGTVKDVVEFVRKADPGEYQSVHYINCLKEVPEVLNEFLPWVVTPGNRTSKEDRMNKVHGQKNWYITDTWGMINDGNHRTVAKILANDPKELECYVGYRNQK